MSSPILYRVRMHFSDHADFWEQIVAQYGKPWGTLATKQSGWPPYGLSVRVYSRGPKGKPVSWYEWTARKPATALWMRFHTPKDAEILINA